MNTYTAKWDRTGKTIFESRPKGNLFGELPLGSWPKVLGKQEDPIDGAVFELGSETITIKKDVLPINFAKPQNVSKEWAKLFLEQWNRAVELWNNGILFRPVNHMHARAIEIAKIEGYPPDQTEEQFLYARICCAWLIPNGFVEPHCAAEGK